MKTFKFEIMGGRKKEEFSLADPVGFLSITGQGRLRSPFLLEEGGSDRFADAHPDRGRSRSRGRGSGIRQGTKRVPLLQEACHRKKERVLPHGPVGGKGAQLHGIPNWGGGFGPRAEKESKARSKQRKASPLQVQEQVPKVSGGIYQSVGTKRFYVYNICL